MNRALVLLTACIALGAATGANGAAAQDAGDGMDAEARGLYSAGEVAFAQGRFENAMTYFQQAYDLSHRPELLYNVGMAADRLRHDDEALAAFERYLAELPDAANRAEVERRVAVLREAIASHAAEDDADESSEVDAGASHHEPAATAPSAGPGAGPWVVLGVGAAAAVAGGVLMGLAVADVALVENAPPASTWSSVRDAYGRSEAESIAGAVLLGVGGAAMIGGLVWAVVPAGPATAAGADRAAVTLEIAPAPGGLNVRGSF